MVAASDRCDVVVLAARLAAAGTGNVMYFGVEDHAKGKWQVQW
jgi:hypothetical protein